MFMMYLRKPNRDWLVKNVIRIERELTMKNMIRITILVVFLFTTIFSAFGCTRAVKSPDAPTTEKTTQKTDATTTEREQKPPSIIRVPTPDHHYLGTEHEEMVHQKILELINVDLQPILIPSSEMNTQVNLMLVSGEQVDIIIAGNIQAIEYLNDGLIHALKTDEFKAKLPNVIKHVHSGAMNRIEVGGRYLGVPSDGAFELLNIPMVREDWMKNLGIKASQLAEGVYEFSINEFEDLLEAFLTKDPNNSGRDDIIPLLGWHLANDFTEWEQCLAPAYLPQAMAWWKDDTGKILPPEMHPGYKEMLAKIVEWYEKDYIYKDTLIAQQQQRIDLVSRNEVGAVFGWPTRPARTLPETRKIDPDAWYAPAIITGEEGINQFQYNHVAGALFTVTEMCEDKDAAFRYLDFMASEEGYWLTDHGIEGVTFKFVSRLPDKRGNLIEYIGTSDPHTREFYNRLYMPQFFAHNAEYRNPVWPLGSDAVIYQATIRSQHYSLPAFYPIDYDVLYNYDEFESRPMMNDMNTFMQEMKFKVALGEIPVGNWDSIMEQWREMGGDLYISERNQALKAHLER